MAFSIDWARSHLCYPTTAAGLRYAQFDGTHWLTETVDPLGSNEGCSLALDGAGQPHISYSARGMLRYAWRDAEGWHSVRVDGTGCCWAQESLALDSAGRTSPTTIGRNMPCTIRPCSGVLHGKVPAKWHNYS